MKFSNFTAEKSLYFTGASFRNAITYLVHHHDNKYSLEDEIHHSERNEYSKV